jgi:hypothetical protein
MLQKQTNLGNLSRGPSNIHPYRDSAMKPKRPNFAPEGGASMLGFLSSILVRIIAGVVTALILAMINRQFNKAIQCSCIAAVAERRDAKHPRAGTGVEYCCQPGSYSLEASGQGSCWPCPDYGRSSGGFSRLARIAASHVVRYHPGRFELDATQPTPHLERTLSAWSCARGRRRDCHCSRLLRLGQWSSVATL